MRVFLYLLRYLLSSKIKNLRISTEVFKRKGAMITKFVSS